MPHASPQSALRPQVADELMCAAQHESPLDFVLCIGNCDADEYMLSAVTGASALYSRALGGARQDRGSFVAKPLAEGRVSASASVECMI